MPLINSEFYDYYYRLYYFRVKRLLTAPSETIYRSCLFARFLILRMVDLMSTQKMLLSLLCYLVFYVLLIVLLVGLIAPFKDPPTSL
ncbi:hypothetical protein BgiMline_008914 [Biomphalaria glabrata]